jgi:hypothetical protein
MSARRLLWCFRFVGFAVLVHIHSGAFADELGARLCAEADLMSGDCRETDQLVAGNRGFAVEVTSSFADPVPYHYPHLSGARVTQGWTR